VRDPQRHVLVLDVNVYLEVAELVGAPFEWAKLDRIAAQSVNEPIPCRSQRGVDSLRLVAACTSGRFAGSEPLEVWSCAHIDSMVESKAMHPVVPPPGTTYRGLGWTGTDAAALVNDLVVDLGVRSNGGTLGATTGTCSTPPLDHEDGMVYGACRELAGDDPLARVYCATRDRAFVAAGRDGGLSGHTKVLQPAVMLELIRRARAAMSIRAMSRPPGT
jgi:hypothetical protein